MPQSQFFQFSGTSGAGAQDFTKMGVHETMKLYYGESLESRPPKK